MLSYYAPKQKIANEDFFTKKPLKLQPFSPAPVMPDYYSNNLPFFCREELKIQHAIGMPVKLRVGTVQECDYLEGKHPNLPLITK